MCPACGCGKPQDVHGSEATEVAVRAFRIPTPGRQESDRSRKRRPHERKRMGFASFTARVDQDVVSGLQR